MAGLNYTESFAERLRVALRRRFGGQIPLAAFLARELNQFESHREPVSSETVRRWLRGLSVPELHRFQALCRFLKCEPAEVSYLLLIPPATDGDGGQGHGIDNAKPASGSEDVREALYRLISAADSEVLSAAYMAFLVAPGMKSIKPKAAAPRDGPDSKGR